jgi:hypothetical protein
MEDSGSNPATQGDAAAWAQQFGHNGIVVADGNFNNGQNWYPFGVDAGGGNYNINLPSVVLVDHGMVIATKGEPSPSQIEAALN